ncbi:hypothetical protein TcWFU_001768 [Taenia crassiceps]|uniref:Transmembrane protein 199 n=1 Tax=Taenia crassiceps TaxID=6207 RepID=A0ABR4QFY1_9CEST
MKEDPYVHIDLRITEEILSFLKRAASCEGLATHLKSSLDQLPKSARTVKFSLVREAHESLKALGVSDLPPLWKLTRISGIVLPEPYVPPRDIIVQQRVESLTRKFANLEYSRMTSHLPPLGVTAKYKVSEFGGVRCVKRQIMMIINFVLVVIGSFVFGYFLCDIFGQSNATPVQRIACGFTIALFVFFADFYFLLKNMDACEIKRIPARSKHAT